MNPFDLLKAIYTKTPVNLDGIEVWVNIQLCKWLASNKNVTHIVAELVPYMFYIEPKHFYYMLWLTIPKQAMIYPPKKSDKDLTEDLLLAKVQEILGWSERDVQMNRSVLDLVLKDKAYWAEQLGVTNG